MGAMAPLVFYGRVSEPWVRGSESPSPDFRRGQTVFFFVPIVQIPVLFYVSVNELVQFFF